MEKPQPGDLHFAQLSSDQLSRLQSVEDDLNNGRSHSDEIILLAFNKAE